VAREFGVTFDYLCPFARNAHEAVVNALRHGDDLDVRFVPFSLNQAHVPEGEPAVWERESGAWGSGVSALLYGIAVRDAFPEKFLDFHIAAFAQRHDLGKKFDDAVLADAVRAAGLDVDAVRAEVESGRPLKSLEVEHTDAVTNYSVFGVPTFITGGEAVFIRFMERGNVDDLNRALDLIEWTRLNEFKRTRIPR
jgi:protein-disulfide isomerase